MNENSPKFQSLKSHLDFLIEQLNNDINYLRESDPEIQEKFESKIRAVMKRICLETSSKSGDISFLHEDFQNRILAYETEVSQEFSEEEISDLSKELKEQIKPDEFVL